jgi:hypothetical protein
MALSSRASASTRAASPAWILLDCTMAVVLRSPLGAQGFDDL